MSADEASGSCKGRGPDGDHCCYVDGDPCSFLVVANGVPRCSLWALAGRLSEIAEWRRAPIGKYFAERHPGFDCKDWPQNLPEFESWKDPSSRVGLCCFTSARRVC